MICCLRLKRHTLVFKVWKARTDNFLFPHTPKPSSGCELGGSSWINTKKTSHYTTYQVRFYHNTSNTHPFSSHHITVLSHKSGSLLKQNCDCTAANAKVHVSIHFYTTAATVGHHKRGFVRRLTATRGISSKNSNSIRSDHEGFGSKRLDRGRFSPPRKNWRGLALYKHTHLLVRITKCASHTYASFQDSSEDIQNSKNNISIEWAQMCRHRVAEMPRCNL